MGGKKGKTGRKNNEVTKNKSSFEVACDKLYQYRFPGTEVVGGNNIATNKYIDEQINAFLNKQEKLSRKDLTQAQKNIEGMIISLELVKDLQQNLEKSLLKIEKEEKEKLNGYTPRRNYGTEYDASEDPYITRIQEKRLSIIDVINGIPLEKRADALLGKDKEHSPKLEKAMNMQRTRVHRWMNAVMPGIKTSSTLKSFRDQKELFQAGLGNASEEGKKNPGTSIPIKGVSF